MSSKRKVTTLQLEQIEPSKYNPKTRTQNLKKLKKALTDDGQLVPISVVAFPDGKYRIADGHRRYQALTELEAANCNVVIHYPEYCTAEELLDKLFVELNKSTKSFNGRDKLNVALQDGPVFDSATRSAKEQIQTLFNDPDELSLLIRKQITTTVFSLAKKSTKYVMPGVKIDENSKQFKERVRRHVLYFMRNNAQQAVTAYMRQKYSAEALKNAIDNNRPPPRTSTPRLQESWQK